MTISDVPAEDIVIRRRRLCYRAWHRGMLEMDMVLGHFADAHVPQFDHSTLDRLEKIMDELDADLLTWVTGREVPPEDLDIEMLQQIIDFQLERANKS